MQRAEKSRAKTYTYQQLENESDKHFAVFQDYLLQGEGRRVKNISPNHRYTLHNIYHLSSKYHWRERILSYQATVGLQLKKEKGHFFKSSLSRYEENALLTFDKLQSRYGEFIGNISNFWPNEIEDKELKKHIQQKNREKKQMGNFGDIMPLYNDPSADKNQITKQLSHIEKVLTIIGKFQIICDKFVIKLEKGEFQKVSTSGELYLEDLEELSLWFESSDPGIIRQSKERIEGEICKNGNSIVDFEQIKN